MTTDLMTRLEQLQHELNEAQQIANNNYRLYTQAKEQRDALLDALKAVLTLPDIACIEGHQLQGITTIEDARAAIAKAEGR